MSISVGDILRVVATAVWLDGNLNQNVFNAVIGGTGGPYTDGDIVDDALEWVEDMYANLVGNMSDEIDGSQIQVYVYDPIDDDWDEVGTSSWTFNPTAALEQLPRGVAALINAKTTDPDVNGKKYCGGLTEAAATDGLWSAGTITQLLGFAATWYTAFAGGTSGASWVPAIWSPTATNAFALSGDVITPTIPAYQRRRKRGVGV